MFGRFLKLDKLLPAQSTLPGRAERMPVPEEHFVNGHRIVPPFPDGMRTAVFGMGCFWGAERLFWQLPGVDSTAVGYAGGETPNPNYEEACSGLTNHAEVVLVVYDPARIGYEALLKAFWEGHDPTQGMRQGNDRGTQYRSGIYVTTAEQKDVADDLIREMSQDHLFDAPIVTEVLPLAHYWPAEDYHQDFFEKNPYQGYCLAVAAPKVAKFRKTFARLAR